MALVMLEYTITPLIQKWINVIYFSLGLLQSKFGKYKAFTKLIRVWISKKYNLTFKPIILKSRWWAGQLINQSSCCCKPSTKNQITPLHLYSFILTEYYRLGNSISFQVRNVNRSAKKTNVICGLIYTKFKRNKKTLEPIENDHSQVPHVLKGNKEPQKIARIHLSRWESWSDWFF